MCVKIKALSGSELAKFVQKDGRLDQEKTEEDKTKERKEESSTHQ